MAADALSEWRGGWRSVLCGALGMALMTGVQSLTGVVMAPLVHEFGWSRAVITANIFICAVLSFLLAPVAGRLIARLGIRRYAVVNTLAAVPALLFIACAGGSAAAWFAAWIVFGVVNVGLGPIVWSSPVTALFDRSRGLALALTLSGGGIAYLVFLPLAVLVQGEYGWRATYVMAAAICLCLLAPLVLCWFHDLPALRTRSDGPAGASLSGPAGYTVSQAVRRRQFWQIGLLSVLVACVEGALTVHLYPILSEGGLSPLVAGSIASLLGGAIIVGRIGTGLLLDRLPANHVYSGAIMLVLLACLVARNLGGDVPTGAMLALLLGLGAGGTTNALAYVSGRYFGLRAYASIFGMLMGAFGLGFGIAPLLAAGVREAAHSYRPIFDIFTAASLIALLLAVSLGQAPAAFDRRRALHAPSS